MVDANYAELMEGLNRLADKLYRRNPREWQKSGMKSREQALQRLNNENLNFPELAGKKEGNAALFAFANDYAGDRVLALIVGLKTMTQAAFENKSDFYILDSLNEQKLYNCARNFEVAIWKLNSSKDAAGKPLLFSNELDGNKPNLSFEREFGRLIGLLDFQAKVVADKNGRSVSRAAQGVATMIFLPVSLLGF